ncbi:MAG: hypothetical protein II819_09515 [Fibrobacter sp.]|nr:hypothetical protein [Fibrobacter sp.]
MTDKNLLRIGFFGVFLGCLISFSACGSDSSSSSGDDLPSIESSESNGDGSADSGNDGSSPSGKTEGSSTSAATSGGSAAQKSETVSGKETLMEAQKIVNGTCGPSPAKINKGEIATWEFYRSAGEVYNQIMAPFVWTLKGAKNESLQGNGLNSVNVRYADAGTYTAKLNVDGNEITCSELQVQGVPITVEYCKPVGGKETANAGETVTWEIKASSDSEITGYVWSYEGENTVGDKTKTFTLGSDLHKVNVAPTVTVTNKDKTSEKYVCASTYVINPNKVDYTFVKGGEAIAIPTGEVWVVQIPEGANTLVCQGPPGGGATMSVFINDEALSEPKTDYFDAKIGSFSGQKVQFKIETNASTIDCNIPSW